jgi:hypothetical protein
MRLNAQQLCMLRNTSTASILPLQPPHNIRMRLPSCLTLRSVPRTPPRSQPLQCSKLPLSSSSKRRPLRPRAGRVLLQQELQYVYVASSCCSLTRPLIPRARLGRACCQPLDHLQPGVPAQQHAIGFSHSRDYTAVNGVMCTAKCSCR